MTAAQGLRLTLEERRGVSDLVSTTSSINGTRYALCPEIPVVVFLLRLWIGLGLLLRRLRGQHVNCVLICRVNVRLRCRHRDLDLVLIGPSFDHAEICGDLVVALRAP